jgi:hypothetical protein
VTPEARQLALNPARSQRVETVTFLVAVACLAALAWWHGAGALALGALAVISYGASSRTEERRKLVWTNDTAAEAARRRVN